MEYFTLSESVPVFRLLYFSFYSDKPDRFRASFRFMVRAARPSFPSPLTKRNFPGNRNLSAKNLIFIRSLTAGTPTSPSQGYFRSRSALRQSRRSVSYPLFSVFPAGSSHPAGSVCLPMRYCHSAAGSSGISRKALPDALPRIPISCSLPDAPQTM